MSTQDMIREQVTSHPVVLYMKGTPQFPQCGFSSAAVQMLKACGVESPFTVNVLTDPEIRQGVKDYANWPTIPQLYVKGEFVGGSDIMREMYESGRTAAAAREANRLKLSRFRKRPQLRPFFISEASSRTVLPNVATLVSRGVRRRAPLTFAWRPRCRCWSLACLNHDLELAAIANVPRQRQVVRHHGQHVPAGGYQRKLEASLCIGPRRIEAVEDDRHIGRSGVARGAAAGVALIQEENAVDGSRGAAGLAAQRARQRARVIFIAQRQKEGSRLHDRRSGRQWDHRIDRQRQHNGIAVIVDARHDAPAGINLQFRLMSAFTAVPFTRSRVLVTRTLPSIDRLESRSPAP